MKFKNGFFVIGTDTDIGKTYVSALLYKALKIFDTHYFKPIQSGCFLRDGKLIAPDVDTVTKMNNLNYDDTMVYYTLKEEVSPHLAAELEGTDIKIENILKKVDELKQKYAHILFEGAGGLYVPLIRDKFYIYDLIKLLNVPVILVCSTRVGAINHTMLTINALRDMNIEIFGLVFNRFTDKFYEIDNIKNVISMSNIKNYIVINEGSQEISEEDIKKFFGGYIDD